MYQNLTRSMYTLPKRTDSSWSDSTYLATPSVTVTGLSPRKLVYGQAFPQETVDFRSGISRSSSESPDGPAVETLGSKSANTSDTGTSFATVQTNGLLLRSTFLVCTTSLLLGYDIGVTAGAIVLIKQHFSLSDLETELAVGCLNFTATFGVFLAGSFADAVGRRKTVTTAGVLFLVGALAMCSAWSYWSLLIGRLVTGLGVGAGLVVTPLYICEIAPPKYRAALTSATEIAICVGVLCGYLASLLIDIIVDQESYAGRAFSWRTMLGFGLIPSAVLIYGGSVVPESPRWLVANGRESDAYAILLRFLNVKEEASKTINEIKDRIRKANNAQTGSSKIKQLLSWASLDRQVKSATIAGIGIAFLSQATGIEAVTYYSDIILRNAGFTSHRAALKGTALIGVFKVLAVLAFTFTADPIGRRPLLMLSCLGTSLSMGGFAVGHFVGAGSKLMLAMFALFVCAFSVGIGPLTYLVPAELFPQQWRSWGVGSSLFIARLTSAAVATSYLSLVAALTPGGVHMLFGLMGAISVAFGYYFLPETKQMRLEDID